MTMHERSVSIVTQSRPALCDPMDYSTPDFPVHHQLLDPVKLMSIESLTPFNLFIHCCQEENRLELKSESLLIHSKSMIQDCPEHANP